MFTARVLTTYQVSRLAGCTRETVRLAITAGKLPTVARVGHGSNSAYLISLEAATSWAQARRGQCLELPGFAAFQ